MHRQRWRARAGLRGPVVALCLMALGVYGPSQGAEFACVGGDVACLIAAIEAANANGEANTITLAAGTYTLIAVDHDSDGPTGLPSVTSPLTLQGAGAQSTVIERAAGAPQFRLLHVAATGVLTLEGFTLQGGDVAGLSDGGGLHNRGTVTIAHSILGGHAATRGGGIYNIGTLTITHSTLRDNATSYDGGGILNSGSGTFTITHSTVSGNVATGWGGGIWSVSSPSAITHSTLSGNMASGWGGGIAIIQGTITLTNSTLSGNTAAEGGGLHSRFGIGGGGQLILGNTLLAGNRVLMGTGPDCHNAVFWTSRGHNLIGDPTGCGMRLVASDLTGDPGLGLFTDYGGPGQGYIPLLPTSRALDAGDPAACPATDQLGRPRVGPCDIGAVEFQLTGPVFVTNIYVAALARLPDASELASWVDVLTATPTPDTVRGMLHVVFAGPEFRQRPINPWQYVEALYQAMLGRAPDRAESDWWVQAVLDRYNMLLPAFLDSPEFQRLVPSCHDLGAVTPLVGRLYQQVLRRVPSWEEIVWWTDDIITWCALEESVEVFFNTGEYLGVPRTLTDHVTVLYRALLAREPDAGGRASWVEYLAGQLAAIEDAIMASPEFEAYVDRLFP